MLTTKKAEVILTEHDSNLRDKLVDKLTEEEAKDFVKFLLEVIVGGKNKVAADGNK